jgi:hypothetical protein
LRKSGALVNAELLGSEALPTTARFEDLRTASSAIRKHSRLHLPSYPHPRLHPIGSKLIFLQSKKEEKKN